MTSILAVLSLLSVMVTATATTDFNTIISHSTNEDRIIIENNNLEDWDDYYNYLSTTEISTNLKMKNDSSGSTGDVSDAISDVRTHLETNYSDYYWTRDVSNCGLTSDVTNNIPIEMKSTKFPDEEIKNAIKIANVENYTTYGGCGPIASMGILDYFARYLGYNEIISDPTNSDKRTILATEVLTRTHFSMWGSPDNTLVWPWDNASAFNSLMETKGIGNIISANDHWTLFGGEKNNYWNMITTNIDEGVPVTLFTGLVSGSGAFAEHYTNIYGYDTWVGIPNAGGSRIEKTFIKARINGGRTTEYYCDADILNCGQTGLITYNINYSNLYNFYANDFSEEFINSSGGGQYFFNEISKNVSLSNGVNLYTNRLRTSYIENKYLVLSPNRANAGTAYLDISFPNRVQRLSFNAAMWSGLEGQIDQEFKIQYMSSSGWKDYISISPSDLTTLKDYPNDFTILFPKNTSRIRFYSSKSNPIGDRNKGRIVLDNFQVKYN